jgi:hypothetical protein
MTSHDVSYVHEFQGSDAAKECDCAADEDITGRVAWSLCRAGAARGAPCSEAVSRHREAAKEPFDLLAYVEEEDRRQARKKEEEAMTENFGENWRQEEAEK